MNLVVCYRRWLKKPNLIRTGIKVVCFNPFPNRPWFLRVCSTSLLKTAWEKEKLLVTFPTVFSTRFVNFLPFSSNLKLSSAKSFSLEESKLYGFGKWLTLSFSFIFLPESSHYLTCQFWALPMQQHEIKI